MMQYLPSEGGTGAEGHNGSRLGLRPSGMTAEDAVPEPPSLGLRISRPIKLDGKLQPFLLDLDKLARANHTFCAHWIKSS